MLDVPADSSRRDAERLCRYLCRNPSGRRGAFAARCRVTAACMVLSHGRMLDPSDPTRKTLETILAAVLCELGVQYERTSAPRGVPCMSRITEVSGYQKTCSSLPPCMDRTTMPRSETDSSMPRCLCTSPGRATGALERPLPTGPGYPSGCPGPLSWIETFVAFCGMVGLEGERAKVLGRLGWSPLPSSKSVCSILPLARQLRVRARKPNPLSWCHEHYSD